MLSDLVYRLRALLRKNAAEAELDEELQFHLEQHAERLVKSGVEKDEALRLARLAIQGPEQVKERCREARGTWLWEAAVQDVHQAVRQLRRLPLTTATIVLTLALCIGANTAVYSVVDALFFRPLPYPEPGRLAMLATFRGSPELDTALDGYQWEVVRDYATLLDAAVYGPTLGSNLVLASGAAYIHEQRISANLFRVLGVPLQLGREFTRSEDVTNGPALAILSHKFWRDKFASDPGVVGRSLTLNGVPYTITGVAAPAFRAIPVSDFGTLEQPDVFTTIRPSTEGEGSGDNYGVIARLKPGVSFEQVNAQLKTLTLEILQRKGTSPKNHIEEERAIPLQPGLVYGIRKGVHVMWAAVVAVLFAGCVNIAGLLLAQSSIRSRELAMRCALGASRFRIVLTLMTESLAMAVLGAGLGILLGRVALQQLIRLNPDQFSMLGAVELDGRVLAVTLGTTLVATLLFGLFPALEASRVDLRTMLSELSRTSAGRRRNYRRYALVFIEISLGVCLVTAAGLLVRTLLGSTAPHPGFDAHKVLVASASLRDPRYVKPAAAAHLFRDSVERIEQIPGVESGGVAMSAPYTRPINESLRAINGRSQRASTELNYVTPSYFRTLKMKLLQGRLLSDADTAETRRAIVVNDTFVHFYLRGTNAVGSAVTFENQNWTVVGVVSSIQENNHLDHTVPLSFYPEIFMPIEQCPERLLTVANGWFSPVWMVRTTRSDAGLARAMQKALSSVDPALPFAEFRTVEAIRDKALGPQRYRAWVVSVVSGLAVLLAALGVYGLVAQSVVQRTRELGIRMALGATIGRVVQLCTAPALVVAVAGVITGLAGAASAASLLADVVWNVSPFDPVTYAFVAAVLVAITVVASLLPAMKLRRMNPSRVLQAE